MNMTFDDYKELVRKLEQEIKELKGENIETHVFYCNLKQKLERVEELRLWIERDINVAKINKDQMAENMATCYNKKLKEILNSTEQTERLTENKS